VLPPDLLVFDRFGPSHHLPQEFSDSIILSQRHVVSPFPRSLLSPTRNHFSFVSSSS